MRVLQINVGGFTNIDKVNLSLSDICALLAYNNFGKSNILKAISFGFAYINADAPEKDARMRATQFVPINKKTAGQDYSFNIELEVNVDGVTSIVSYGYSFAWPRNNKLPHITYEELKIRGVNDAKAKLYIRRNAEECTYLASVKGRCSSKLEIDRNQLAINKLSNYDTLFYINAVKAVLGVRVVEMDTLADPKTFFRTIAITDGHASFTGDMNSMPDFSSCAYFMYNLKKDNIRKYNLLSDAIVQLIPSITDFTPIKVDLKKQTVKLRGEDDVPFYLPEYLYDIRVQERNMNQQVTIERLSSGTKRIFYILLMAIAAEINKIPVLLIEELENSIHPSLFQKLLTIIRTLAGDTQIILTSHSPYLLQYMNPGLLYVGIPNPNDIAVFKQIKKSKINSLMKDAYANDMSFGDYIFDMLNDISNSEDDIIAKFFE